MMRKFLLILSASLIPYQIAYAERGDPMMIWPILVQIDWDAYHGRMIENCNAKYPEQALSFKNAIAEWNKLNMATILKIRSQLRSRVKDTEGLSEEAATEEMRNFSVAWTQKFLSMVSSTPENSWKDVCSGKYAEETLRATDFVKYMPIIATMIPTLPMREIRP